MLFNIINEVAKESSKKNKQLILKKHESEVLKDVLLYTYNDFWTYGIKKLDLPVETGDNSLLEDWKYVKILLDRLKSRNLTGNAARDFILDLMKAYSVEEQIIIQRIIKRDMEAGFSASTINKVWPKLIPEFLVALAERYDKNPQLLTFDKKWLCSRKLDGVRCITIIYEGTIRFYSRKGIEFFTLDVIKKEIEKNINCLVEIHVPDILSNGIVLDGEMCLVDDLGNDDFQGMMKLIKKGNSTIKNPKYKVFDVLHLEDFLSGSSQLILSRRLFILNAHMKEHQSKCIEVLEQTPVESEEQFAELNKEATTKGWEGLILRKDVCYEGKRTKNLLKVKKFMDDEYEVVEIITGDYNYSVAGEGQAKAEMMTAVKILHKGYEVKVGSGWSIEQRKEYFANPEKIIGKTINVQYFEETTNKAGGISLRFPTVKFIYENGRDT
jgi:DNA ligase-1